MSNSSATNCTDLKAAVEELNRNLEALLEEQRILLAFCHHHRARIEAITRCLDPNGTSGLSPVASNVVPFVRR